MNPLMPTEYMLSDWRSERQRLGALLVGLRVRIERYAGRYTDRQRKAAEEEIALLTAAISLLARSQYPEKAVVDDRTTRAFATLEVE